MERHRVHLFLQMSILFYLNKKKNLQNELFYCLSRKFDDQR